MHEATPESPAPSAASEFLYPALRRLGDGGTLQDFCDWFVRRELDMLLSAGERISMALLSMAIRELGGNAISFTGSQSGIITNDRHVDARIIEVRPFRIQDELARGRIVVVAGYQDRKSVV